MGLRRLSSKRGLLLMSLMNQVPSGRITRRISAITKSGRVMSCTQSKVIIRSQRNACGSSSPLALSTSTLSRPMSSRTALIRSIEWMFGIEGMEARVGKSFSHGQHNRTVTSTHIGHHATDFQFGLNPFKGWNHGRYNLLFRCPASADLHHVLRHLALPIHNFDRDRCGKIPAGRRSLNPGPGH